ncbi:MAG: hypothetical protein ACKN9W_16120 [Methylococcus sp.]
MAIAWPAGQAEADGYASTIPTAGPGYGVLSYTFFNLSGDNCTLTPYGSGKNPSAYSNWAQGNGWSNNGNAGFFNPVGLSGNQVSQNYIFYNNYDPLNTSGLQTSYSIANGQGTFKGILETTGELGPVSGNEMINYAAVGDSWTIACTYAPSTIAIASLASSANALQSNGPTSYPYNSSLTGWWYNNEVNPPANGGCDNDTNPCGVGFTTQYGSHGNQILNWNVPYGAANYSPTGGLWSGINYNSGNNYNNISYPAADMVNAPMLPINLSAYTVSAQGNSNPDNHSQIMYYTTMWGGHFTLAMGDPFVVNGYAAKALWYLVVNATLSDDTTLGALSNAISNGNGSGGVFDGGSYEDNYVQWLLGSQSSTQNYIGAPQIAANAFESAWKAAQIPVNQQHEKIWGKIFTGLADIAVDAGIAALAFVPGGDVAVAAAVGVATAAGGAVVPDMNAAITNAFTTTTTLSASPPVSRNAPIVINPTYASNDLLGLFLTNSGVQEAINTTMQFGSSYYPLTSNYSINTDYSETNLTGCTNIQVGNNLLRGSCYDSSGATVSNGPSATNPPTYGNVYAANQTTTQMSIWDAILTGSDVTTNENGFMILGNQIGSASFSPPVMMWNASPSSTLPANLAVNTTFNLNSGYLSANSYTLALNPTTAGSYPTPSAAPSVTPQLAGSPPAGVTFSNLSVASSYDSGDGVLSVTEYNANGYGYTFSNGTQTINLTGCPPDSQVLVSITPADNANAYGASGSLSCLPTTVLTPTMAYTACVNDPWATGGVIAAFTTAPTPSTGQGGVVELACACVPDYLDGPSPSSASTSQLLGGVVVGATSSNPSQQCPTPAN